MPSADGKKFLFSIPMRAELSSPAVVFNWTTELSRK
jgi:hypothetical protein